jgi:hypothetical protein
LGNFKVGQLKSLGTWDYLPFENERYRKKHFLNGMVEKTCRIFYDKRRTETKQSFWKNHVAILILLRHVTQFERFLLNIVQKLKLVLFQLIQLHMIIASTSSIHKAKEK